MKREVIDNATLYCSDCREILSSITSDTVITDPVWPNCPAGLIPGPEDPYSLFSSTVALINTRRLVVVMRHDSDPNILAAIPRDKWPFVLQNANFSLEMPGYIGRKLGGDEIAYSFGDPIPSAPGKRVIPDYAPKVQPGGRKDNGHPCNRALKHFDWLVEWWSLPDETVLDPFMGSIATGRKFIGIEIEPRYFDLACRRIEDSLRQYSLSFSSAYRGACK
jgi:hypothetical protein